MTTFTRADVDRLARLSRLRLADGEAARLAPTLDAIARDFARLADRAAALPPPDEPTSGALRDDVVETTDARTVDLILAAAPRVDPTTKALRVDRA